MAKKPKKSPPPPELEHAVSHGVLVAPSLMRRQAQLARQVARQVERKPAE